MAFATKHFPIADGVPESDQPTGSFSERSAWVERFTPLRRFVRTETGGAALLIAAVFARLAWANVGARGHDRTQPDQTPCSRPPAANRSLPVTGPDQTHRRPAPHDRTRPEHQ